MKLRNRNLVISFDIKMKTLFAGLVCAWVSALAMPVQAHDTPNFDHTHAFRQTGYGTWRQGHSVSGPQGSIIIWSPRSYAGYQSAPNVRFARPEAISRPPGSLGGGPKALQKPILKNSKKQKRN